MILDIIVLAVLLISAIIAFLRGLIREILTILGVVGGLAAAYFGGPMLSPSVRNWFTTEEEEGPQKLFGIIPYDIVADAIAYGSIFIVVVVVLSVASHFLSGWAKTVGLGAVDRILGIIFGILRAVVILAVLYLPLHLWGDEEKQKEWSWLQESKSHYYVAATSSWIASFIPEKTKEDANKKIEETAESMAKATREQLQEMDVLSPKETEEAKEIEEIKEPVEIETDGYKPEQREDLGELIDEKIDE